MKIIDLLNKIANGEEVPHIQYDDIEAYLGADGYLKDQYGDNVEWWIDKKWLNHEVEIIEEEKKIPEKIEIYEDEDGHYFIDNHCKKIYITCDEVNFMVEEFNQLIDYLKSKGE